MTRAKKDAMVSLALTAVVCLFFYFMGWYK